MRFDAGGPGGREYLTPTEAGALLGVDAASVRRYIAAGMIRAVRIGRRRLFVSLAEVERFQARERRTEATEVDQHD